MDAGSTPIREGMSEQRGVCEWPFYLLAVLCGIGVGCADVAIEISCSPRC